MDLGIDRILGGELLEELVGGSSLSRAPMGPGQVERQLFRSQPSSRARSKASIASGMRSRRMSATPRLLREAAFASRVSARFRKTSNARRGSDARRYARPRLK